MEPDIRLYVVLDPELPDGTTKLVGAAIHFGTHPLSPIEQAGRDARQIVRRGLADILEWLPLYVVTEMSSEEFLAMVREHAEAAERDRERARARDSGSPRPGSPGA